MPFPPAPGEITVGQSSAEDNFLPPGHGLEMIFSTFVRFFLATVAGERFRNLNENAAARPIVMRRLRGVKQGRQEQISPMQHSTIVHRRISVRNPGETLVGYLVYAKKLPISWIGSH